MVAALAHIHEWRIFMGQSQAEQSKSHSWLLWLEQSQSRAVADMQWEQEELPCG